MPAPLGNQNALGNEGGAPSQFNEQYISDAYEYVDTCVDDNESWVKSESEKGETRERIKVVKLPTHEGFAIYLTKKYEKNKFISPKTLYTWAGNNVEFQQALEYIKMAQKQRVLDKGLAGEYNSTIAKLILGSNHDMIERQKIENTNLTAEDLINQLNETK